MIVLRVWVDMPEPPPLLLPALDRVAVGVETEVEVELLSEPSEAVTTMTVVEVMGVALSVVETELSEVVVGEPADVVVASVVGGGASFEVEVVVGVASVVVADVVVGSAGVVVGAVVSADEVEVVEEVVVGSWEVVSLVGVTATVLPLPVPSALLPCLSTKPCVSLPNMATLMKKPWVAEVADKAATTNLRTLAECMMFPW